jgi:rubrerythrin
LSAPILVLAFAAILARDGHAKTLLGMPLEIGGPIFFGLTAAAVLFSWRNWRCPGCDSYLGRNVNPQYCPACGLELHG